MKKNKSYADKLRDPRWQKRSKEILDRDGWKCQCCGEVEATLNVHHKRYLPGGEPWESPDEDLITVCRDCHKSITEAKKALGDHMCDASFLRLLLVLLDCIERREDGDTLCDMVSAIAAQCLVSEPQRDLYEQIRRYGKAHVPDAVAEDFNITSAYPRVVEATHIRLRRLKNENDFNLSS